MRVRIVAALAAAGLVALGAAVTAPARAVEPTSWIVTLTPGADPAVQAPLLASAAGGTVGHVYTAVLGGFSFAGTSLQAEVLRASPAVASVVPDGPVSLAQTAQLLPTGVSRVDGPGANVAGATGDGVTVAVIDSGIDLAHPDLLDNVHPTLGANCITPGLPAVDDNGHGTHVAGTIAAADNGFGVVGVAPAATLVPVKAFDALGESTWAKVICGIDYVAAHAAAIDVANMSFGDLSTAPTACDGVTTSDFDALRQAVCDLTGAGVTAVAAAGNNMVDVAGFVPAAFPETIAVSALSDTDGQGGGAGGCIVFGAICDDGFASLFSNYGPRIDVMAPGFQILSTMLGGAYSVKDGTSMAAPHVSGVAALMLEENGALDPDELRAALRSSGECPDGTAAGTDGSCGAQGAWPLDPDGVAEPLVDAAAAAAAAAGSVDAAPTVSVTNPTAGTTVAGTVVVTVLASDDRDADGTLSVELQVDGGPWAAAEWDAGSGRYRASWDTRSLANGSHTLTARATDSRPSTSVSAPVTVTATNGMHIADLGATKIIGKRSWQVKVTVTVHTVEEALAPGVVVSFAWGGGASATGTCTTGKKGTCTAASPAIPLTATGEVFTVEGASRSGQTYTPALNHDGDGDSDGTTIAVAR